MSNAASANDATLQSIDTSFGIFYPVGYIVAGFPEPAHAEQVRRDLLTGGYDAQDCVFHGAAEVADATQRNLAQNTGFLATLGRSDDMVRRHLEAARKGAAFLLIYAPGDLEASRAMNVVRRVPFVFAHRYHRLAIEELS
jgi:hypothetical protein